MTIIDDLKKQFVKATDGNEVLAPKNNDKLVNTAAAVVVLAVVWMLFGTATTFGNEGAGRKVERSTRTGTRVQYLKDKAMWWKVTSLVLICLAVGLAGYTIKTVKK